MLPVPTVCPRYLLPTEPAKIVIIWQTRIERSESLPMKVHRFMDPVALAMRATAIVVVEEEATEEDVTRVAAMRAMAGMSLLLLV